MGSRRSFPPPARSTEFSGDLPEDGRRLSRCEGEALGLYLKASVLVEARSLGRTEAMIYLASDLRPGKPRNGCLELILKAATDHHFPEDYIASLASWQDFRPATPELS